MSIVDKSGFRIALCIGGVLLAGCNSGDSSGTSMQTGTNTTPPEQTTAATTATGTTTGTGTAITGGTAIVPTLQNLTLTPSNAVVLTLDTGTNTVNSLAGSYIHTTQSLTSGGTSFAVSTGGNSYVGGIIGGGNNQVVALQTAASDMPLTGGATYNGSANVSYLDTPSGRLFDGTMVATVTASFNAAGGSVDVALSSPNGTFGGANYNGPGQAVINGLVINGASYASAGTSTSSVTGFTGATGLNSGAQTVTAQGVFGGPTANETGAVAIIQDGVNGQALVSLTARQ